MCSFPPSPPSWTQKYLAHPLVPQCEEVPDPQDHTHPKQQPKSQTVTSMRAKDQDCKHLQSMEEIEIEMEVGEYEGISVQMCVFYTPCSANSHALLPSLQVFPPFRVSESELVMIKSDHPSIMTTVSLLRIFLLVFPDQPGSDGTQIWFSLSLLQSESVFSYPFVLFVA